MSATTTTPALDLRELQTVQEQLERQRAHLATLSGDAPEPVARDENVAVLTWPGDSATALVISRKPDRVWIRTVGTVRAPDRVSLCPGLDDAPATELLVHARFEFSDGVLLELKRS